MNIWIINHNAIPPSMGGLVRHYYFAKNLREKKNTIKIFSSGIIHNTYINMVPKGKAFVEKNIDGVNYIFIKGVPYYGNGFKRIINLLEFPARLYITLKEFQNPDVIYTSSPDLLTAFASVIIARALRIPCVVEIRDLYPETMVRLLHISRHNIFMRILYRIEAWIYKKADQLIFTMEGGTEYIEQNHRLKNFDYSKVHVINNGINLEEFQENLKNHRVSDDNLLNSSKKNIIYAGSIRKANNLISLIQCAQILLDYDEIQFLIYGTGNEKESLEKYCKEHGITNVIFKGFVEKKYLPFILSKSFLNIMNYSQDFLGEYGCSQNKLFEYFASGKPVLSNIRSSFDLIERYRCGLSENIKTPQEYADAILNIISLPDEEYQEMCCRSLNAAWDYDYRTLSEHLEKVLHKAIRIRKENLV